MHHSYFFKKCFIQRSLKKVVSDLTAWTSFRSAGTGWKLKLGGWVCSWLLFYFCRMTGIPACYLGSAQSKQVKDSIRGWVFAKLSGTLSCDIGVLEGQDVSLLHHHWNSWFWSSPGTWHSGYCLHSPRLSVWRATAILLCLLAGEMELIDSAVFWSIPDFSEVLDLYHQRNSPFLF